MSQDVYHGSSLSPSVEPTPIKRSDSPQGYFLPPDSGSQRGSSASAYPEDYAGAERKRKRNKPTLSCAECVERKTKCDRGRPHCLACIRRGTECRYRRRADAIEDASTQAQVRRIAGPPKPKRHGTLPYAPPKVESSEAVQAPSTLSQSGSPIAALARPLRSNQTLLSNIPYSVPSASNIYGIGSEHPFNNYWTLTGGLSEVISVLPSKDQADILVAKFFDSVDPIYPLLHEAQFYAKYNAFWRLSHAEKSSVDTSFLALLFVMLAMGTQFLRLPGDPVTAQQNQSSGAEFYASACHQALRIGAYLNRTSVPTLQAMVLMTYFLMNANHASDGWAFAGIIIRQAYAMGLNRDPSLLFDPGLTAFERQERKRLWTGVVCQDAFMSVILKLPPGATHADIDRAAPLVEGMGSNDSPETSVSSPSEPTLLSPGGRSESSFDSSSDLGYVNGMYTLALLVQETISSPRSLSLPMAATPRHRSQLLGRFRAAYRSFPDVFRAWDEQSLYELSRRDTAGPRMVRQILFLTSNYWHCVMLVQIEGCEQAESATSQIQPTSSGAGAVNEGNTLTSCIRGALEAGHEAIRAFFVLHTLLEGEAGTWWVMAHRAFTEALAVADILKKHPQPEVPSLDPINSHWRPPRSGSDDITAGLFMKARLDVLRMIEVLKGIAAQDEISRTRVEVLEDICRRMER